MPDPDLEMVVGGGRSPKNLFRSKNKGGGASPLAPLLDPPLEGMHH